MNVRNIVIALVVLAVLGGGFWAMGGSTLIAPKPTLSPIASLVDYENLVTASGTLLPAKRSNLSFRVSGQVQKISVNVGDQVKAGAILIRMDATEAEANLKIAQATLAQLRAGALKEDVAIAQANVDAAKVQLAKVRAASSPEDVVIAKASFDRASALLKDAQAEYDKVKDDPAIGMFPQSAALQSAIEQYRIADARLNQVIKGSSLEDIRIAEAAVTTAQANLDRAKVGARPEEITAAQARVDQAQSALAAMTLSAPFSGTVAAINVREGEVVSPGIAVITLGDLTNLRLETDDLSETSIARVKLGQVVDVSFEALQGKTFKGKVTDIAPMASAKQGGTNYTVYIDFDRLDPMLRWGMTGHIEINTMQ